MMSIDELWTRWQNLERDRKRIAKEDELLMKERSQVRRRFKVGLAKLARPVSRGGRWRAS